MNDKRFYVYEHWRTDRAECFYVGKGHGRRAYDMRRGRNRWHKFLQAKLSHLGTAIDIKIIANGLTEREAFDIEVERIAFWKNDGADLCNLTLGGDGPSGRKHTEAWKLANSERMKGRIISEETRAKQSLAAMGNKKGLGYKRPRNEVDRLAALNRGKKRSPEVIEKLREIRLSNPTFLGKHHTEEVKSESSARQKGIKKSDEARRKMSLHKKSYEHKRKLREFNLGKTHSEETRKKLSEISKADWARRKALKALENRE